MNVDKIQFIIEINFFILIPSLILSALHTFRVFIEKTCFNHYTLKINFCQYGVSSVNVRFWRGQIDFISAKYGNRHSVRLLLLDDILRLCDITNCPNGTTRMIICTNIFFVLCRSRIKRTVG